MNRENQNCKARQVRGKPKGGMKRWRIVTTSAENRRHPSPDRQGGEMRAQQLLPYSRGSAFYQTWRRNPAAPSVLGAEEWKPACDYSYSCSSLSERLD